jgi:hypothetical protein
MSVQPTDLKAFLNLAATGKPLTASQAEQAFEIIMTGTHRHADGRFDGMRVRRDQNRSLAPSACAAR